MHRVAFCAACILAFGASIHVMRPDNEILTLYNSDSAVPVLMANHEGPGWFDLYYWGQDRFGSLPFLAARAAGAVSGVRWTPDSLQVYMIIWLSAGVIFFAHLFPGMRTTAASIFAFGAVAVPHFRVHLFEIGQFFSWQLPVLFAAMLAIRALCRPAPLSKQALRYTLAAFLSFLALWASPMNLVFLLAFAAIEAVQGHASSVSFGNARGSRFASLPGIAAIFAIAAGAVGEQLMRWQYHRSALALYGNEYRTMSWINRREIPGALESVIDRLTSDPWMMAGDLAGIAAIGACLVLCLVQWRRKEDAPPALRTALALGAAGLLQIPILASVHHFTVSGYPARFFFLTHAGLFAAAALLVLWLLFRFLGRHKMTGILMTGIPTGVFLTLGGILFLPAHRTNPAFTEMKKAACCLARTGRCTFTHLSQTALGRFLRTG